MGHTRPAVAGKPPGSSGGIQPYDVLFGPWSVGVAWVVVVAAVVGGYVLPPDGLGIELCWWRRLSGLPCPGCGLTRSVCHLAGGRILTALWFHPFGLLVLPFAVVSASSLLWSAQARGQLRRALERHRAGFGRLYRALVYAFLAYGVLRTVTVGLGLWPAWG